MITCPDCGGLQKVRVLAHYANDGCKWQEFPCFTCNGLGEITEEHMNKINIGKAMREDRLKRNLSQREEAKCRGMTAIAYSKMEHGQY